MTARPVLIIGFRRLSPLQRVMAAVREAHPGEIYLFIDGARPTADGAPDPKSREVQAWASAWADEDPRHRLRIEPSNRGISYGVPTAIEWVLGEGHDALIVLEDDCLPSPDFFPWMQEMLSTYADDPRVMMISGDRFVDGTAPSESEASYHFSRLTATWGWGTWARAWSAYRPALDDILAGRNVPEVGGALATRAQRRRWVATWTRQRHDLDHATWDSVWFFAMTGRGGLCAVPSRNLVRNIGWGKDASNTFFTTRFAIRPRQSLAFPIQHPEHVVAWSAGDEQYFNRMHSKHPWRLLLRVLSVVRPDSVSDEL